MPLMKFFPLEAMELLQSYEWAFKDPSSTRSTLRLRSTIKIRKAVQISGAVQLHNPPPRVVSRKPDLIHGNNKRLIALAYDKFVAEVLQRIIDEAKFSMQGVEEDFFQMRPFIEDSPLPSPIASSAHPWSPVSPTDTESSWSYSEAMSPISALPSLDLGLITEIYSGTREPSAQDQHTEKIKSHEGPLDCPEEVQDSLSTPDSEKDGSSPNFDTTKIPRLMDIILEKEGRKHLLKNSFRWATRRKQMILKAIRKNGKHDVTAQADAEIPQTSAMAGEVAPGKLSTGVKSNSTETLKAPEISKKIPEATKYRTSSMDISQAPTLGPCQTPELSLSVKPGKLDPSTGLWDFTAPTDQQEKVKRPSVRDLFTPEFCARNPNVPVPRSTSPMSGEVIGSDSVSLPKVSLDNKNALLNGAPGRAMLPKLTIETQLSPMPMPHMYGTRSGEPSRQSIAVDKPRRKNTRGNSESYISAFSHATDNTPTSPRSRFPRWYRSSINSPTSKSPVSSPGPWPLIMNGARSINDMLMQATGMYADAPELKTRSHHTSPSCEWRGMNPMFMQVRRSIRGGSSRPVQAPEDDYKETGYGLEEEKENEKPSAVYNPQAYERRSRGLEQRGVVACTAMVTPGEMGEYYSGSIVERRPEDYAAGDVMGGPSGYTGEQASWSTPAGY